MSNEQLLDIFKYHTPNAEQAQSFNPILEQYWVLAQSLANFGLGSPQKTEAIIRLLESLMWAEAHVAASGGGTEKANDKLMAKHAAIAAAQSAPEPLPTYPAFPVTPAPVDQPASKKAEHAGSKKE